MTKVVLITGASRGIGAATARLAAKRGWAVGLNYRSAQGEAEALVREIVEAGGAALSLRGDVSREAEVEQIIDACVALGPLTGLVNNAGILPKAGPLMDIDLDRWNRVFATNTTGTFLCCRAAARRMARSRGGRGGAIVNVTSMAAVLGAAGEFVDYAASKGAIDAFTIGLARELAAEGVRVNGVRPGIIETEIHALGGEAERVARLAPSIPMQRAGTAEEVAQAILWLLSEEASYSTGTVVTVSGGR